MLSKHFAWNEFTCKHCGRLPAVDPYLLDCLERLRSIVGKPLPIISGYRCEVANRNVGGTRDSEHLLARAADIPRGYATVAQCKTAGFVGIGTRGGRPVHVDVRRAPWSGRRSTGHVVFKED